MTLRLTPNRVIKYLIVSDLSFWTGWGLINPIFAVFIVEKVQGGNVFIVGLASGIFLITKSLFRVPIGVFLDISPSEKDDYFTLVAGLLIAALVPFGYIFVTIPLHIFILQAVLGIGLAMSFSGWTGIFTRHIDKGRESTNWGLHATSLGFGMGIAGAVGGWAVNQFGFNPVFIAVGVFGLIGVVILFGLRSEIRGVFDDGFHFSLRDIFDRENP